MEAVKATQMSAPVSAGNDALVQMLMQQMAQQHERSLQESKLAAERHQAELKAAEDRAKAEREATAARLTAMEARADAANLKLMEVLTKNNQKESDPLSIVTTFAKLRDLFMDTESGGPPQHWGIGLMEAAAPIVEKVIDGAKDITGNLAKMNAGPAIAVQNTGAPSQIQQPQPPQETPSMKDAFYARQMGPAVIEALKQGRSGHSLGAELVMNVSGGEGIYGELHQRGPQSIIGMFQQAPEVWGEIVKFGGRIDQFAQEFCNKEAVVQEIQAVRAQQQQPGPQAVPKPNGAPGRTVIDPRTGKPVTVVDVKPTSEPPAA
jgi:hypothetical protein